MVTDEFRVLVLGDSRSFHLERYLDELHRQGVATQLISMEDGQVDHLRLPRPTGVGGLYYLAAAAKLKAIIRRHRPHVINPHFVSGYGFLAALAGARRYAPVLLHCWGSDILIVPYKSRLHHWKTRKALCAADFVTADSEYLLSAAEGLEPLRDKQVIPWGVEKRYLEFHREDYRKHQPLRVIVPRHHEPVYGNTVLFRALTPLVAAGAIHMAFPAWGSLAEEFRQEAAGAIGEGVILYDKMPREAFMAYMAQHDVYLSGARSDSSPVSLIEAMGLGLVPVAPDIPGNSEWLTPESGYVFDLESPDGLRQIIEGLASSDDDLAEMRRCNLERVRREATFEANIDATIGIMRQLAQGRRP